MITPAESDGSIETAVDLYESSSGQKSFTDGSRNAR